MSDGVGIMVNTFSVGEVAVNGERVRGEGGPYDARLVLPLRVSMNQRPLEQQLALTELSCSLHLVSPSGSVHGGNQFGPSVTANLLHELSLRSVPDGPSRQEIEHFAP